MEYEIKPKGKSSLGIGELWEFRELFYFFTWRDIKVKYKQAALGVFWAILQPLFMTIIFTFLLGKAISSQSEIPVPYPVFALSGMLLWGIFSGGMSNAANSMVTNANIIKKIYFPRLIIPISAVLVACVDFLMALIIFIAALIWYGIDVSYTRMLLMPVAVLLAAIAAMGVGMFFAALNIKYRDVRYIIPFMVQALLFLTPVIYPVGITGNRSLQLLLQFNPIAGALELFRGIFEQYQINWQTVGFSSVSCIVFFMIGMVYFRKTEAYFADLA